MKHAFFGLFLSLVLVGRGDPAEKEGADWKQTLQARLPLYGHRNWIVIADSAYPAQARDGIETLIAGTDQTRVLDYVLHMLSSAKHVRPNVYTDRELEFLQEADAPGVESYRDELKGLLEGRPVQSMLHEQIISRLDEAGKTFRVLIIKTNMTIPYTSVFLQLDCAYWPAASERKLRAAMAKRIR